MPQPIAYLAYPAYPAYPAYNGNCADATRFYERALNGKLEVLMSGAESPMAAQMPEEFVYRILHARLALPDGGVLFAGDAPANMPCGARPPRGDRPASRSASSTGGVPVLRAQGALPRPLSGSPYRSPGPCRAN